MWIELSSAILRTLKRSIWLTGRAMCSSLLIESECVSRVKSRSVENTLKSFNFARLSAMHQGVGRMCRHHRMGCVFYMLLEIIAIF